RHRIPTPQPSTPQAVAEVIAELVGAYDLPQDVPIGVAFPAPLQHGVVRFIANLDKSWTGVDLPALVARETGRPVVADNAAAAAGVPTAASAVDEAPGP
ncbi:ROK family protein, partial [Cellulosimicrobium funkei]